MSGNWYVSMTLAVELSDGSSWPRDLSSNVKISLTVRGQLTVIVGRVTPRGGVTGGAK